MAAVPITLDGVLYDLYNRTTQRVILMGDASLTGVGIGGGPVYPPDKPPYLPGYHPEHPIYWPPGSLPHPEHPIVLPPEQIPPDAKPQPPAPGSPTTVVPGNWPVAPIVPPPYLVVNYPGVGPVVVAPPAAPAGAKK